MNRIPLLDELPAELDLPLELDEDLTVFLSAGALRLSGLRPGEPLAVDVHPLSLRLETLTEGCLQPRSPDQPLALLDIEGRLYLPLSPPLLAGRRVVLQVRNRGLSRELYIIADRS